MNNINDLIRMLSSNSIGRAIGPVGAGALMAANLGNLTGYFDGEDIGKQFLGGLGGAGVGLLAGKSLGNPFVGAAIGSTLGEATGNLLPKLTRNLQQKKYNNLTTEYGEPSEEMLMQLEDKDFANEFWKKIGTPGYLKNLSPEEEAFVNEYGERFTTKAPRQKNFW
jgi:hypothetical protein